MEEVDDGEMSCVGSVGGQNEMLSVPENSKSKAKVRKTPKLNKNEIVEDAQEKTNKIKKEEKWKPQEIIRFLELYEMYPCLWDYKIPEYKDRNAKEQAWEGIVQNIGKLEFNVKKAKDKIRVLRNTYCNELIKIKKKSKSSGKGLDDVYTPTLRWFSTMDRIVEQVIQTRVSQSIGLPDLTQVDAQVHENEEILSEPKIQRAEVNIDPMTPINSAPNITPHIPRARPPSNVKSAGPYVRPLSKKLADQRLNKIENAVEELKDISNKLFNPGSTEKDSCEFDLFGRFISAQLKKLPEAGALGAMQDIQSCLMQRRINCISTFGQMTFQRPQWDEGVNATTSSISSPGPGGDNNTDWVEKDLISAAFQIINDDEYCWALCYGINYEHYNVHKLQVIVNVLTNFCFT